MALVRVHTWVSPCDFYVGQFGAGTGFCPSSLVSLVNIISPWLHTSIVRGMNNRPVGSRSSETYFHPIHINNMNIAHVNMQKGIICTVFHFAQYHNCFPYSWFVVCIFKCISPLTIWNILRLFSSQLAMLIFTVFIHHVF